MSAASFMAKAGWKTIVLEKHITPGGRARQLKGEDFRFDMGPSWYWMPDVYERYFNAFGKKVSDYYTLKRLDPSYRVVWPKNENNSGKSQIASNITGSDLLQDHETDIPADLEELKKIFEQWEPGAGGKLDAFLAEARIKYETGMQNLVYKPGLSLKEYADKDTLSKVFRLDIFTSLKKHIRKYFKHPRIRQLLEFPGLFLGALPKDTPALYSLMNYADMIGGTWYPDGGMYSVVLGMYSLAQELGVEFYFEMEVTGFRIKEDNIKSVFCNSFTFEADLVINSADYNFVEQKLLPEKFRMYTSAYWEKRKMAPSCLVYYIGIDKKLKKAIHHTLFFDSSFDRHAKEIYKTKSWPDEPLFYVSVTSVTDRSVAPEGYENLFFLVPVAAGLIGDTEEMREKYFDRILERFEKHIGEKIKSSIVFKDSFAYSDFVEEYNSFKGNAYGLANTLLQTAVFKPSCKSSKINNLYFTGQLTVPGPGVPPCLISGEVVAGVANSEHLNHQP